MVLKCCVCGTSQNEASLFSFPKNEQIRIKWREFAEIAEDEINTSKLCQRHFKEDQIKAIQDSTSKDGNGKATMHKRRLISNAIPSLKFDDEGSNVGTDFISNKYCLQCKTTDRRIHFKFPENVERRNEWLRRCGYAPDFFNGDKTWYLCARHFSNGAMVKKSSARSRSRIRLNAVPTLFMADTTNESSSPVEETASNQPTIGSTDYSLFPTRILPAINKNIVFMNSACIPEKVSCTPDMVSLISDDGTEVAPSTEIPSSLSISESSTGHDFTTDNESTTSTDNIDTDREMEPKMPHIKSSVERDVTHNNEEDIDYISPSTISKILDLHRDSNCKECIAFLRHIHNSSNAFSQPQITPVPRKAKKRLCYPGDISAPDYATPKRAERSINLLKSEIEDLRRKCHIEKQRNRRLRIVVKKHSDLINHRKGKDKVNMPSGSKKMLAQKNGKGLV